MNVLDTIDNAIDDWETSEDAMRWTPDPPPPRSADTIAALFNVPAELVVFPPSSVMPDVLAYLSEQMSQAMRSIGEAINLAARDIRGARISLTLFDETHLWSPVGRDPRLSQIRREYRRRHR